MRPSSRFAAVYRTGTSGRAGGIRVVSAPADGDLPRVGVVAGRSVGGAVRRNRAKRRMREVLREMKLLPETDYVVIASRSVVDVGFEQLEEWMEAAIRESVEGRMDDKG